MNEKVPFHTPAERVAMTVGAICGIFAGVFSIYGHISNNEVSAVVQLFDSVWTVCTISALISMAVRYRIAIDERP